MQPNTRYYYRYGHSATNNFSPEYSTLTAPTLDSATLQPSTVTRVLAFGDLGVSFDFHTPQQSYVWAQQSVKWMMDEAQNEPDVSRLVLHIGDIR